MSSNVVDLLGRRARRGQRVIHFKSAREALEFATTQVRELQDLADSALLLDAKELEIPLAQATAVLAECARLHAQIRHEENA